MGHGSEIEQEQALDHAFWVHKMRSKLEFSCLRCLRWKKKEQAIVFSKLGVNSFSQMHLLD